MLLNAYTTNREEVLIPIKEDTNLERNKTTKLLNKLAEVEKSINKVLELVDKISFNTNLLSETKITRDKDVLIPIEEETEIVKETVTYTNRSENTLIPIEEEIEIAKETVAYTESTKDALIPIEEDISLERNNTKERITSIESESLISAKETSETNVVIKIVYFTYKIFHGIMSSREKYEIVRETDAYTTRSEDVLIPIEKDNEDIRKIVYFTYRLFHGILSSQKNIKSLQKWMLTQPEVKMHWFL